MKTLSYLFILLFSMQALATDPKKAYDMVLRGSAVIVDVRELEEIQSGMVEKAIWFPKSQLMTNKAMMDDFKSMIIGKKVFLYCHSGKRAEMCTKFLQQEGIDAENLGGFETLKKILPVDTLIQRVNQMQECKT